MTLESWLERATRLLAPASVEKVRAEITEHYESALQAELARGKSGEDAERAAVESLGNPSAAWRGYRKVLLTAREAKRLEFWKTPNPTTWPLYSRFAVGGLAGALGVFVIWVLVTIAMARPAKPLRPEPFAFVASMMAIVCIGVAVFALQGWRRSKPASGQVAVVWVLHAIPLFGAAVAAASYSYFGFELVTRLWASLTLVMLVTVTASTWPINTPRRYRVFRFFKWAALLAASLLVLLQGTLPRQVPGILVFDLWAVYMLAEWNRHSLRKKLPFSEWPPELCR